MGLMIPIFLQVFEGRLADELPRALEVQAQRLLERDPEEPESLQLPSALQRTGVYSSQAPIAHELRHRLLCLRVVPGEKNVEDRKSTRLNSSHANISYAVFCLKKKKK